MPPGAFSRHVLVTGVTRVSDGLTYLLDREPLRFRPLADTRRVLVQVSDTWQSLASTFFEPIQDASQLWWIICDFQPEPIIDPTIGPTPGTYVYIPTPEFVLSEIFSRDRRGEVEI